MQNSAHRTRPMVRSVHLYTEVLYAQVVLSRTALWIIRRKKLQKASNSKIHVRANLSLLCSIAKGLMFSQLLTHTVWLQVRGLNPEYRSMYWSIPYSGRYNVVLHIGILSTLFMLTEPYALSITMMCMDQPLSYVRNAVFQFQSCLVLWSYAK